MEGGHALTVHILNAEPVGYKEEARRILEGLGRVEERCVSQECLAEAVQGFDVLLVRLGLRVTEDVLDSGDTLRVVATAATGLDHIDLDAAEERGVAVLSLRGEQEFLRSIPASAEHTWALLLSLLRQVPWAFESVLGGGWDRDSFRGNDLYGKKLGVLGFGRIGEKVAGYGLAFGMEVASYDTLKMSGWLEGVRRFHSLDKLLAWSEVLSVHVPLNGETRGMLNEKTLRRLPRGAWLVNTSRGAVIDEAALVRLLEEGYLAGGAVDVLEFEQPSERRTQGPLARYAKAHSNLLITPHLGGATTESMRATEVFMAKKLRTFLRG